MVELDQQSDPAGLALTGFVGDYRGGRDALVGYRPVVRDAHGRRFVAMRDDWSVSDLAELSDTDDAYVHPLPERPITPGSLLWLAGQTMINRSSDLEPGFALKTWASFTYEYRFHTGTRDKLVELSTRLLHAATRGLHAALFDQAAVRAGAAQRFFRIIDNLAYTSAEDRQIQRALYYFEMREMARYEMVKADMVIDRQFAKPEYVDAAVRSIRKQLAEPRLREMLGTAGRHSGAKPRNWRSPEETFSDAFSRVRSATEQSRFMFGRSTESVTAGHGYTALMLQAIQASTTHHPEPMSPTPVDREGTA